MALDRACNAYPATTHHFCRTGRRRHRCEGQRHASAVFSRDISHAFNIAKRLHAGSVWVNCYNQLNPFGGYKQSGIGRELGQAALANYSATKSIHINLTQANPLPIPARL